MTDEHKSILINVADKQAEHLGNLIVKSSRYFLEGRHADCYYIELEIRENFITYEIKDADNKALDDLEKKISNALNDYLKKKDKERRANEKNKNSTILINNHESNLAKTEWIKAIRTYRRALRKHLKALGYFPDKKDRTRMNF